MGFADSVGLIFRINADGSQAIAEAKKVAADQKRIADEARLEILKIKAADGLITSELNAKAKAATAAARLASLEAKALENKLKDTGNVGTSELNKLFGASGSLASSLNSVIAPAAAVATGIAAIGAAAVGAGVALFAIAKDAADFGSEIHDIAAKTGLGAETISTLAFAAKQAGTDIASVSTSLTLFEKNIGKAAEGGKAATEVMKRLGIDPKAAINDLDGALAQVFKRISELKPGVEQTKAATDAFGRSGAALIPIINDVGGDFEAFKQQAKALGVVLTDEDARAADEFGDTLDLLKSQAQGVGFQFAKQFMPDITRAMNEVSKFFISNQETVRGWGQAVSKYLRETLNEITSQGGGWQAAGGVLARRFVDGFATIIVQGITGAVNAAAEKVRNDFREGKNQFDPVKIGSDYADAIRQAAIKDFGGGGSAKSKDPVKVVVVEDGRFQKRADGTTAARLDSTPNKPKPPSSDGDYLKDFGSSASKAAKLKKEDFELSADGKVLVEAAKRLGVSALDLASIIAYESAYTFSPKIKGGKGGNYTGLIQFGKEEAKRYDIKNNNTFDKQLLNAVVPFLKDRFKSVGRVTEGATILDLYKTINGGNPNVSSRLSDNGGKDSIASHVERILREAQPKVLAKFFGGKESNVPTDKAGSQLQKAFEDEQQRSAKLAKIEDDRLNRRADAQNQDKKILIDGLNQEVELRASANKRILAEQESLLASEQINEEQFARGQATREEQLLDLKATNKGRELEIIKRFNRQAVEQLEAEAVRNTAAARPEDRAVLEGEYIDKIKALRKQNQAEEAAVGLELIKIDDDVTANHSKNQKSKAEATRESIEKRKAAELELLELQRDVLAAEEDIFNFRQAQQRKVLVNTVDTSSGKDKTAAIIALRDFEIAEEERQNEQRLKGYEAEIELAFKRVAGKENEEAQKAAIIEGYQNKALQSEEEFQAQKKAIAERYKLEQQQSQIDASGGGFLGGILQGAGIGAESLNAKLEPLKTVGDIIGGQFNAIAGAVGNAVQAFVLYGNAGTSVRKVTAQILASIAQQSAVQAVFELAQGFAKLALAFFGIPNAGPSATAHFTAAATFGLIAGVAAVAGRAVAGNSFQGQGGGASNSFKKETKGGGNYDFRTKDGETSSGSGSKAGAYSGAGDKVNLIDNERSRRQEITLNIRTRDSHIVDVVKDNVDNRGSLHGLIVKYADA